jgi:hypothetical protein
MRFVCVMFDYPVAAHDQGTYTPPCVRCADYAAPRTGQKGLKNEKAEPMMPMLGNIFISFYFF